MSSQYISEPEFNVGDKVVLSDYRGKNKNKIFTVSEVNCGGNLALLKIENCRGGWGWSSFDFEKVKDHHYEWGYKEGEHFF